MYKIIELSDGNIWLEVSVSLGKKGRVVLSGTFRRVAAKPTAEPKKGGFVFKSNK